MTFIVLLIGILMPFIALFAQGDMRKQSVNKCLCVCSCLPGAMLLMVWHACGGGWTALSNLWKLSLAG